jgi:hypothetical protein
MSTKSTLKTIRLTRKDEQMVKALLKSHPYINNFSTLVRAALVHFMNPQEEGVAVVSESPSFIWDYNLKPAEILEILRGPRAKRLWLVARILEHASWNDVWKYLSLDTLERDLPYLRMSDKTKRHWAYALKRWRNK